MSQTITIKLTKIGSNIGPFNIYDQLGNLIAENVSKTVLTEGISYIVEDNVTMLTIKAIGKCKATISKSLKDITRQEYDNVELQKVNTACLWAHLIDHTIYNSFYGTIEPYVLEYPFSYQYKDEILQNVEEYDKVFKYLSTYLNVSDRNAKIQVDAEWFNKAIVYNGQQSSGVLDLHPKPINNMKEYLTYPKYNSDSKSILWTKVDNLYQYNTFWSMVKDKLQPLFLTSCESLSIDKVVNQENMDYSVRAYKKDTIRAKDLKIRHILDDKSDITIVTQFIITPTQQSYL